MPYRNDQLVGCLHDALQGDLDELINLPLPDTDQHQFNQINLNTNQYNIVDSSHQQIEGSSTSNQFIDSNTSTSSFDFQSGYEEQLDLTAGELNVNAGQLTANNSTVNNIATSTSIANQYGNDTNLDIFDIDDALELNHLKDLENLMDTAQLDELNTNQLNSDLINTNQLNPLNNTQLNSLSQATNQVSNSNEQQIILNNQPQSNQQQLNQRTGFLASPNRTAADRTNHPHTSPIVYESGVLNIGFNTTTGAQINSSQRIHQSTPSSPHNIQIHNPSTSDNGFIAAVNSTPQQQVNSSNCNNYTQQTNTSPTFVQYCSPNRSQSQISNSSTIFCDEQPINNSNLLNSNQLKDPTNFYTDQQQVFCGQSTNELQQANTSNMIKSDLQNANLLASNLNCYQTNPFSPSNRLISSPSQLINNSQSTQFTAAGTQSVNLQRQSPQPQSSIMRTNTLINSNPSTPVKTHVPQFKNTTTLTKRLNTTNPTPSNNNLSKVRSPSNEWLDMVARQVADDMRRCGICVIDNFLGDKFCNTILDEVIDLYSEGKFNDGLLVGNKQNGDKNIRGDLIHWVEGKESNTVNIGFLMRTLDQIMVRFSQRNVDGCTSITNRTKAMLACYAGNASRYVKHVDNPNNDGRYITCIYYLNKNWNSERDGGVLRIFPKNVPFVANIEPFFDRMIFFWSDRRNPHEVMPSYSIRFAITLWYFDSIEREQYIKKMQNFQKQQTQS